MHIPYWRLVNETARLLHLGKYRKVRARRWRRATLQEKARAGVNRTKGEEIYFLCLRGIGKRKKKLGSSSPASGSRRKKTTKRNSDEEEDFARSIKMDETGQARGLGGLSRENTPVFHDRSPSKKGRDRTVC